MLCSVLSTIRANVPCQTSFLLPIGSPIGYLSETNPWTYWNAIGEPVSERCKVTGRCRLLTEAGLLACFACTMAYSAYRNIPRTSTLRTCTTRKHIPLPMEKVIDEQYQR